MPEWFSKAQPRRSRTSGGGAGGPRPRIAEISRRLRSRYGRPGRCAHEEDPIRNLILTILSQNTTDANRDRAYSSLMGRFPAVSRLARAKPAEVEEAIRVGGLAKAKTKAILSALSRMEREHGGHSLDFLRGKPLAEARAYLTSLPGVGVKTANVLLLFSFGQDAFPVDTHILRVTKRLGLVPPAADLARAALLLEPYIPTGEHASLHLNLIRLGREICRPGKPLHAECPLLSMCPEGMRSVREHGPSGR